MSILNFQKPDKIVMQKADDFEGFFEFKPLEPGFGQTVGNSLRRVLLSSLEGFAISAVRIAGVDHEFASIRGVVEDVVEIILNLKQVRLKQVLSDEEITSEKVYLTINGKEEFRAGDIEEHTNVFKVMNPDLLICTMEPFVNLEMELTVSKGRGYVPADENLPKDAPIGVIPVDAIYTPIKNVAYHVENTRVGQRTDYEKLTIEVKTDGTIHPEEAIKEASRILIRGCLISLSALFVSQYYFIESFFLIKKKLSISKLFGGSERRSTVCMEGVMSRPLYFPAAQPFHCPDYAQTHYHHFGQSQSFT
jgi:DNA-directed RNA polymerase subunit alpha